MAELSPLANALDPLDSSNVSSIPPGPETLVRRCRRPGPDWSDLSRRTRLPGVRSLNRINIEPTRCYTINLSRGAFVSDVIFPFLLCFFLLCFLFSSSLRFPSHELDARLASR